MEITAALVKELRERTGSGMMECKKALVEANGDIELAIENMRKSGQAKAAKKAGRIAAEGVIMIEQSADGKAAIMVEVNSETDFVAKDDSFLAFANAVSKRVLNSSVADVAELMAMPLNDGDAATIEEARQALVSKIGENIAVRRFVRVASAGSVAAYRHGSRIGVLVAIEGGDADLGKDIAMHVAASNPVCVSEAEVPQELLDKEREIIMAQSADSKKPAEIIAKMVDGRLKKYLAEVAMTGQPFVKNPDVTVGKLLAEKGAKVSSFVRLEVGEGIEKRQENFADEVAAQAAAFNS